METTPKLRNAARIKSKDGIKHTKNFIDANK